MGLSGYITDGDAKSERILPPLVNKLKFAVNVGNFANGIAKKQNP